MKAFRKDAKSSLDIWMDRSDCRIVMIPGHYRTLTHIDFPSASQTIAFGINNRGQIVGSFANAGGAVHNFLFDKGAFIQIDFPGGAPLPTDAGNIIGINDRGQIVSQFLDAAGTLHGFLFDDGVFTTIDVPGSTATGISGINDRGQMIGVYDSEGKPHGFVLDQGVVTTTDIPGATVTIPFGINNHGEIVGGFIDAGGVQHGFLAECDSKQ
jgi:probable HAF family extracellular repeat protein